MFSAKEHTKDVASNSQGVEISLIDWATVTAMKKLLSMLDRYGYIIVKADSVVTRRRTDEELIKIMKDKGLEK